MRWLFSLNTVLMCLTALALADGPPAARRDPTALGTPFDRYATTDKLGRTITFYVSHPPADGKPRPIVLFVQGSGASSVFRTREGKTSGGLQNLVRDAANGRARVLVVEKPGVQFGDDPANPGSAINARPEFRHEHTLPRWVEAVAAAVRAAHTLPDIDRTRTLVMGHSEGGIVSAHIAALEPAVTHVGILAGGGPTQLYDLIELARLGHMFAGAADTPEGRVKRVLDDWAKVQADPNSADKLWLGHPHRRWTSFLATSTLEGLLKSKARVFVSQGTEDKAVAVSGFEMLRAELLAKGRDVTAERLDGVDHSFRKAGEDAKNPGGMRAAFERVLGWFVGR